VRKVKLFAIALLSVTALAQERGITCTTLRQSDEYYSAVCKNTLHNPPVYTRHETDTDESSVKQIDRIEYNRLINRLAAETQDDQRNNAYRAACTKKVWEKVNDMPTQEFYDSDNRLHRPEGGPEDTRRTAMAWLQQLLPSTPSHGRVAH
jgi:hypothetical protein